MCKMTIKKGICDRDIYKIIEPRRTVVVMCLFNMEMKTRQ